MLDFPSNMRYFPLGRHSHMEVGIQSDLGGDHEKITLKRVAKYKIRVEKDKK